MPQFDTGTPWDQGLNSLGAMLFPDPSRIAQAGLYGAQQRNAKLQGDQQQMKLEALQNLRANPHLVPQGNYAQPGPELPDLPVPKGPWPAMGGPRPGVSGQPPAPGPVPGQGPAAPAQQDPNALASIMPGAPGATNAPPPISPDLPGAPSMVQQSKPVPPYVPGTATKMAAAVSQTNNPPPGIYAPEGGRKFSDMANHDGSPMPAPSLDLGKVSMDMTIAGFDQGQINANLSAMITEAYQAGAIGPNTYSQALASVGRGEILSAETTLKQQAMQTGGVVGEQRHEYDTQPRQVLMPDGTPGGVPQDVWNKNYEKYRFIDPSTAGIIAQKNLTPVSVYKQNPDGSTNPNETETVTGAEAIRNRRTTAPSNFQATGENTGEGEKGAAARDKGLEEATWEMYPTSKQAGIFSNPRKEASQLEPDAKAAVNDLALKIFNKDPELRRDQKNFKEAQKRAMKQLQTEGYLDTPEVVAKKRDRYIVESFSNGRRPISGADPALGGSGKFDAEGNESQRFKIKLRMPYPKGAGGGKTGPAGDVFTQVGPQNAPQAGGPQAKLTAPTSGTFEGQSKPGVKDGTVAVGPTGEPYIIRNGIVQKMSAAEREWYEAHKNQGPQTAAPQ